MRKLFRTPKHLKYPMQRRIAAMIAIAFLVAASVGLVCSLVIHRLNDTLHQQQQDRMAYLELGLDQQMGSLDNTMSQIIANPYLQILAKAYAPLTAHQRSLLYSFNREFKQYVAANTLWGNTMLHFSRSGFYQEGGFSRSAAELYRSWAYTISFEEWQTMLNTTLSVSWRTVPVSDGQNAVEIWYPLSLTPNQEQLGMLVIRMDKNELLAFLTGMRFSAEERILLLDAAGNVLCDTGGLTDESNSSRAEIINKRTGWQLVSLLDTNALEAPARFCMQLSLALCGALLLAGVALGLLMAVRSYEPIERLYSLASEKQEIVPTPHSTREAYDLLENNFRALIERHDNAQLKLLHQKRYVRDHLLARLLNATWAGESAYSPTIFQENGITFPSESVFLLRVLCLNPEETQEISQIRINYMLEEVLSDPYGAMFFIYDMNSLGIVNLPQTIGFDAAVAEIRTYCLRLAEKLKDAEKIELAFICSSCSVPVTQLPALYRKLTQAEDYFQPGEKTFLTTAEIMGEVEDKTRPGLTAEKRNTLCQAVENEDYEQAISLVQRIYGQEKKLYGEASDVLFCTMMNMTAATMTALQMNSETDGNDLMERLRVRQRLLACSTVPAQYTELIQILSEASVSANDTAAPRSRILYEVRSYVDTHYSDDGLSVSELADRTGMSISSLSRAFKREMGYNLLDYINKIRVEAVMHSLTESDDTLEKIAERTGYINVNTLIRNFKRYVGMTPGKYKQSLAGNRLPPEGG